MSELDKTNICHPILMQKSKKSSKSTETIILEDSDNENDEPVEIIDENDICKFIEENDVLHTSVEPDFFQDSQESRKSIEIVDLDSSQELKRKKSIEIVDLDVLAALVTHMDTIRKV